MKTDKELLGEAITKLQTLQIRMGEVPEIPPSKSGFKLSQRSLRRLEGVHPGLVKVVKRAIEITEVDFGVTEGLRTKERQAKMVAQGSSWTMNSRHLTGHAVDLVAYEDGQVSWAWPLYYKINDAMQRAAAEFGIKIKWGGTWKGRQKDGPHFQLTWKAYPV